MRPYDHSFPWLSFRWEPRKLPYPTWLLLGEVGALATRLREAPVPADQAVQWRKEELLNGAWSNAALDGNTLTWEQVVALTHGDLHLTGAQLYLATEVENLLKAYRWMDDRFRAKDRKFTPWTAQLLNAQVLKGLPWSEEVAPGQYRSAGVSASGGDVRAPDVPLLMERLCAWLESPSFEPEEESEKLPFALVRAFLAHLYLLWIKPFQEGNGRVARLVEYQLLLNTGVPAEAIHAMIRVISNTRQAYFLRVSQSMKGGGEVGPVIDLLLDALATGLRDLWQRVDVAQHEALLRQEEQLLFHGKGPHTERQRQLLQDLRSRTEAVRPGGVVQLSAELAIHYARLHPKTLQRDLLWLREHGLITRAGRNISAAPVSLKSFRL